MPVCFSMQVALDILYAYSTHFSFFKSFTVFIHIEAWAFISYKQFKQFSYISLFHILYKHLFTLERLIPAFIRA